MPPKRSNREPFDPSSRKQKDELFLEAMMAANTPDRTERTINAIRQTNTDPIYVVIVNPADQEPHVRDMILRDCNQNSGDETRILEATGILDAMPEMNMELEHDAPGPAPLLVRVAGTHKSALKIIREADIGGMRASLTVVPTIER